MPANCAEISKVTSGGGNWILRDLERPEAKAFDRKRSPGWYHMFPILAVDLPTAEPSVQFVSVVLVSA